MVNRRITGDSIAGSYSHIKKTLDRYFEKHFNTGQITPSINWKKLLQQLYVDSQTTSHCLLLLELDRTLIPQLNL